MKIKTTRAFMIFQNHVKTGLIRYILNWLFFISCFYTVDKSQSHLLDN